MVQKLLDRKREKLPMKVLIIEDERDIAELISYNLKEAHFETRSCHNGREGLLEAQRYQPHLIVLDLMLPDMNGLEVCRQIKSHHKLKAIPILMLTAKGEETDRIVGLELGADDYVTKPFSPRELLLRIQAILRRSEAKPKAKEKEILEFGLLRLDEERFEASVEGKFIELTALEFKLLKYLLNNKGRVASREALLEKVWGHQAYLNTRTVDTHIKRLRAKLGPAGSYIETIRGMGYRMIERA
ncbi:MAG: response regulator transcription factor [Deltaproteobacteria bacterium]|nr:response regulator transcription factor [Deltaproteobacteria bacterium]